MLLLQREHIEEHFPQFNFWQILHFFKHSGHILLLHEEHFNIHNLQNFFYKFHMVFDNLNKKYFYI